MNYPSSAACCPTRTGALTATGFSWPSLIRAGLLYLAWSEDRPVGLVLVRALDQPVRVLNGFFIVRALRRAGIGRQVVRKVLIRHPGDWEVAFQSDNEAAVRFWRRVATETAGDRWTEELRAVPAKPHLPPDVWIAFSTEQV